MRQEFLGVARHYWRTNRLWSRSWFAGSAGGAPISVLRQYIDPEDRHAWTRFRSGRLHHRPEGRRNSGQVVATALPAIRLHLHASLASLEWTANVYTLTFAVLLLTGAALGEKLGRRRMLTAGVGLFTAASAACGWTLTPGRSSRPGPCRERARH